MPRATVGTFVVGSGIRVGQNTAEFARARLKLYGRPYSILTIEDAEVVVISTRAKMLLRGRSFTLKADQTLGFPAAKLHLSGRPYLAVVPVGPSYDLKPQLHLGGRPFVLALTQTLAFEKPLLRLVPLHILRVGQPGLVPTFPELIVLTPSPVEVGLLVPTEVEVGELLTPSPVRNI
jgi:hypothetical protein